MEWSSFFGGVFAALAGVFATVLVTEWIETKKHKFESKKALSRLYIELTDLHEECEESLSVLKDTYYRTWRIEKSNQLNAMWDGISIPKPPNTIVLESQIEKVFGDLTKEQRKGVRSILYLCRQINNSISSLIQQIDDEKIRPERVQYCMSELCALYHLSLNMKEQEGRFIEINKQPKEVQESVFKALGIDLSFQACANYQLAT